MSFEVETVGLWLLGVGAALLLPERVIGQPRPRMGLMFPTAASSFSERLHFSFEITGLLVSAVDSALFIGANLPPIWFMAMTLIAVAAIVYWLLTWLALKYWSARLTDAIGLLRGDLRNQLVQWQLDCMRLCASWRWALRHPFERNHWPSSCQRMLGPSPAGIVPTRMSCARSS